MERLKSLPKATQLTEDNPRLKHEFSASRVLIQDVMLLLLNVFFIFLRQKGRIVEGIFQFQTESPESVGDSQDASGACVWQLSGTLFFYGVSLSLGKYNFLFLRRNKRL